MNEHISPQDGISGSGHNSNNEPTYLQLQENFRQNPAFNAIMDKLYSHLRAIAANVRKPHRLATLHTTELLHAATIKLMKARSLTWNDEAHFEHIVARAMKQILIDSARSREAEINGGNLTRVPLDEWLDAAIPWDHSMLDLDRALNELGEQSSREAQAVDLRFYGGFSIPEIAAVLQVSESTVRKDLDFAFRFLSIRVGARIGVETESLAKTRKTMPKTRTGIDPSRTARVSH